MSYNIQVGCTFKAMLDWPKKPFPAALHRHHQPELLAQGDSGPWIHAAEDKFGPFSSLQQACAYCLRFLFLAGCSTCYAF